MRLMHNQRELMSASAAASKGILRSRPAASPQSYTPTPGAQRLGLAPERDAILFVPAGYTAEQPAPLMVMLHGAGGAAEHGLGIFQRWADETSALLLAPASQGPTWDVIRRSYGADVAVVDRALEHIFTHYAVDPAHLAVGGFSDGASYALSLGLINGDLFTHIIALSPGFMAPTTTVGQPRIFISHGTDDTVLPIERCSHVLVPRLKQAGYDVDYHEFAGGHTMPPEIVRAAETWFIAG